MDRAIITAEEGEEGSRRGEQLLAVLRATMPSEDRRTVYGMKARRLIGTVSSVLSKAGFSEHTARLRQWSPTPVQSALVKGALVSTPDVILASTIAEASSHYHQHHLLQRQPAAGAMMMSIVELMRVCDRLTKEYLRIRGGGGDDNDGPETLGARQVVLRIYAHIRIAPRMCMIYHYTCVMSRGGDCWSYRASSWGRWRCSLRCSRRAGLTITAGCS